EAAAGRLDLADQHVIRASEQAPGTGILNQPRFVGRSLSFAEIIDTTLVYSDNTGADIIIDRIGGFDTVNGYARRHGYAETLLQRRLAFTAPAHDNYPPARDCAHVMQELAARRIVDEPSSESILASLARRRVDEDPVYDYLGRYLPPS